MEQEKFMHGFQFTPQQLSLLKEYSKTGFQPKMCVFTCRDSIISLG